MEHACHSCGAAVEDGVPFCPRCGAPQIRVMAAQPATGSVTSAPFESTPQPPIILSDLNQITWANGFRPASLAAGLGALAALMITLGMGVPQLAFLVWMLGGGMLAVAIYRRRQHVARMTARMGARLGAITGLMGFIIFAVLSAVQLTALRAGGQFRAMLEQQLKASAARSGNPEAQQLVQQFLTPQGMVTLLVIGVALMLVLFLMLSTVGGAIAGALSGSKETRRL